MFRSSFSMNSRFLMRPFSDILLSSVSVAMNLCSRSTLSRVPHRGPRTINDHLALLFRCSIKSSIGRCYGCLSLVACTRRIWPRRSKVRKVFVAGSVRVQRWDKHNGRTVQRYEVGDNINILKMPTFGGGTCGLVESNVVNVPPIDLYHI